MPGPPGVRSARNNLDRGRVRLHRDGGAWRSTVLDVSLTGIRIVRPRDFHPVDEADFELELQVDALPPLAARVVLVRLAAEDAALRFDRLSVEVEHALRGLIHHLGRPGNALADDEPLSGLP